MAAGFFVFLSFIARINATLNKGELINATSTEKV